MIPSLFAGLARKGARSQLKQFVLKFRNFKTLKFTLCCFQGCVNGKRNIHKSSTKNALITVNDLRESHHKNLKI